MSPRRDERGAAGSMLTLSVVLCLLVATMAGVITGGWIASAHKVRHAADLAALAGAQARARGGDACVAATDFASRNGARLSRCSVRGDLRDVVVHVEAQGELVPVVAGVRRTYTAAAEAGSLQRR